MIDTIDLPELKTREQVIDHYRQICPLLAAYEDVVAEHAGPRVSINEPCLGGISDWHAAGQALARIGRPARDEQDARHALAYIREMQDERATLLPPVEQHIQDYVISESWVNGACVPTADEWNADDDAERECFLDVLVDRLPDDELPRLLRETLEYAMPAILRHITAQDEAARRRASLRLS